MQRLAHPSAAPLTEVVQALIIDGTVTGIDSLYRYRLEVQELERAVATSIRPYPLLALEPGREGVSAGTLPLPRPPNS